MDNRTAIFNQAQRLFAERGYDAVGVQDIAVAAGVTKPTLYHYFGSKAGLLEALISENANRLMEQMRFAAEYRGDLPKTMMQIVTTSFAFARAEPHFYRMLLSMWFALPGNEAHLAVLPYLESLHQIIEQTFRAAVPDHGNIRGHERMYSLTLLGLVNTYIGIGLNGYLELNDELAIAAVRQFSHGIYS